MVIQRGERLPPLRDLIRLGPAPVERMALETKPTPYTVACFVMTRAAQRSWSILNARLGERTGALFWICGEGGAGKTHFLNLVSALDRRAGPVDGAPGRAMTLVLDSNSAAKVSALDAQILEALTKGLGGGRAVAWWRQLGESALEVALGEAARTGVRSVSVALDFGLADAAPAHQRLDRIAAIAKSVERPRLSVVASGRGRPPSAAITLEVAPRDHDEKIAVAIGRARQLTAGAQSVVEQFYARLEPGQLAIDQIFPFHPSAIEMFARIAQPLGAIHGLACQIREVLAFEGAGRLRRLIYPCDLFESRGFAGAVEARLGAGGRAALERTRSALNGLDARSRLLGQRVVETLVLEHLCGRAPAPNLTELCAMTPPAPLELKSRDLIPFYERLLEQLSASSRGAIKLESNHARFDPPSEGAQEVAAFNSALELARAFDPTLTGATELAEARAKLRRLGRAMAGALEAARRTKEVIAGFESQDSTPTSADRERLLADFIELAGGSPDALLEASAEQRQRWLMLTAQYEDLAAAASRVPLWRKMREYLESTGLRAAPLEGRLRADSIDSLATECQLLTAELCDESPFSNPNLLESLHSRVRKFRSAYIQRYRIAHEQRRQEIAKLVEAGDDAARHLDALRRLDRLPPLGRPKGPEFELTLSQLRRQLVPCESELPLGADEPRCRQCGFVLGTVSPRAELMELFDKIGNALSAKLALLSQSAIARLMREHDHQRRLEGFLKVIQAAQTDALVKVLNDDLTDYLAEMLKEERAGPQTEKVREAELRSRGSARRRR